VKRLADNRTRQTKLFMRLSQFAAAAMVVPAAAGAQSMPGMDSGTHQHHGPATPAAKPKPKAKAAAHAKPALRKPPLKTAPARPAQAAPQDMTDMPGMEMEDHADHGAASPTPAQDQGPMDSGSSVATDHGTDGTMAGMDMSGMAGGLGAYFAARDASGTAWQPDSAPMDGIHGRLGDWSTMIHGYATLIYDRQGGRRGDDKTVVASMMMGMAQRPVAGGTLTLRAMGSLDPLMGKRGYPLLLATGETADGKVELVDRQHPHDAVMELAATYSHPFGNGISGFVYFGLPGEPALGPATYMHRYSGMANPEAPIAHHWLDSTHVTFGVATLGLIYRGVKVEGSLFTGREPDQHRWDIERPRFDSWSARVSWNPTANVSMQASHGFIKSPELLHLDVDVRRTTASLTYNRAFGAGGAKGNWQTSFAWGRNDPSHSDHGHRTDAFLLDSAVTLGRNTLFGRVENVDKDELFADDEANPLADRVFNVTKASLGYYRSIPMGDLAFHVGGLVSKYRLPQALQGTYGSDPTSFMLFVRIKLGD